MAAKFASWSVGMYHSCNCIPSALKRFSSSYAKRTGYIVVSRDKKSSSGVSTFERTTGSDIFTPDKQYPLPGRIKTSVIVASTNKPLQETKKKRTKQPAGMHEVLTTPLQKDWHAAMIANFIITTEKANERKEALECSEHLSYAIQECPKLVWADLHHVFPSIGLKGYRQFSVIIVSQNVESSVEPKELTATFTNAAQRICQNLKQVGYWADFLDPSTGRQVIEKLTTSTIIEADNRYRHLDLAIRHVADKQKELEPVKVISHDGSCSQSAFIGAIFTSANPTSETLQKMVGKHLSAGDADATFSFCLELPSSKFGNSGSSSDDSQSVVEE